jgi:hypothetical protein
VRYNKTGVSQRRDTSFMHSIGNMHAYAGGYLGYLLSVENPVFISKCISQATQVAFLKLKWYHRCHKLS